MLKERIIETSEGIQGEIQTADYDIFMKNMRDKGLMETNDIIKVGIDTGSVLEIGPGPGYLGLEWVKKANNAKLTGLEISANMIKIAKRNAKQYGYEDNTEYVQGNAMDMPFADKTFDAVISAGSLHEWEKPAQIFNEMYRVLKDGGRIFVSDLKRDSSLLVKMLMSLTVKPASMRSGLKSSLCAAYTTSEIKVIIQRTLFKDSVIKSNPFGLIIYGAKDNKIQKLK